MTPKMLCVLVGTFLLGLLSIVPIWNSISLLQDSNYVFWAGRGVPRCIIGMLIFLIVLYISIVLYLFHRTSDAKRAEETIMLVVQIFVTVYGLFFMTASSPLSHQAQLTYNNLLHRCNVAEQTHRLYEYATVLHNIRATPACAKMESVEECKGYEEVAPYTTLLRGMENSFHCSGFCYSPPSVTFSPVTGDANLFPSLAPSPAAASAPTAAAANSSALLDTRRKGRLRQQTIATDQQEAGEMTAMAISKEFYVTPEYPPTLFSTKNFQASCDAMAAREMMDFAGTMGNQLAYQGFYLICTAVFLAFVRIGTFCMPKSMEEEDEESPAWSRHGVLAPVF